ncbi:MAG: hypothetical protein G01um101420_949 [Parcubacteria group bacterium Gr01-1014_20]|nr:MAG: hypothetical protein G01um101420_949 [Parcubacteria group bacterium Gr01-1014_20]
MEHNHDQPKAQENTPLFEREDVRSFITNRKIASEDFRLIEKIASLPRDVIVRNFHNLFNLSKEQSASEIKYLIQSAASVEEKEGYETMLEFHDKYGWMVSWHLVRTLESM